MMCQKHEVEMENSLGWPNALATLVWEKFLSWLLMLKFFFFFSPTVLNSFIFWLNWGEKQNLNDSTYVTQNYRALSSFSRQPSWEVYFWCEQISISTDAFSSSRIQPGSQLGFLKRPAVLLSVLEEYSIAVVQRNQ